MPVETGPRGTSDRDTNGSRGIFHCSFFFGRGEVLPQRLAQTALFDCNGALLVYPVAFRYRSVSTFKERVQR